MAQTRSISSLRLVTTPSSISIGASDSVRQTRPPRQRVERVQAIPTATTYPATPARIARSEANKMTAHARSISIICPVTTSSIPSRQRRPRRPAHERSEPLSTASLDKRFLTAEA
ncbi:hypothetical protein QBC39DRAFT_377144 [Podospora conica]|nr:hypothetical protein QBC39DRAFT_377144 [Schizothecium conicum]